ncbi:thioredoxin family protein [Archaeoglobus profundus]|uniref:Thioredoxin domain protein n=1 Tax=Archaeoglobus profundus (strain DSM 5631 / JCM 9629 / NBRC 100127 / Av18) TaxID=572546 RepID=D2RIC2_ARCPA|nr:thioredoxin family protein [Archaeoglobus profundus]ADB58047.1 Thioredoxin domain protein [Archaeoglobus profundus DSM 5631]
MIKAIVFTSDSCPYCRIFEKIVLNELKRKFPIEFEVVNISKNPDLAEKFNIEIVPTLILVKDGKVIGGFMGFSDLKTAEAAIKKQLKANCYGKCP